MRCANLVLKQDGEETAVARVREHRQRIDPCRRAEHGGGQEHRMPPTLKLKFCRKK
jgi:hypothetical protein